MRPPIQPQPSSVQPSNKPSMQPSLQPFMVSTGQPSKQPSCQPSSEPTGQPSIQPTYQPSQDPSSNLLNPRHTLLCSLLPQQEQKKWHRSWNWESNSGPAELQSDALPLSYLNAILNQHNFPGDAVCASSIPTMQPSQQPYSQPTSLPSRQPTTEA